MDPQFSPAPAPRTGWAPSLAPSPSLAPAPAPSPSHLPSEASTSQAKGITPALAELVYGYHKPAFMTDVHGQIVCMNAAAGRMFDPGSDVNSSVRSAVGPVALEKWDRKATLFVDGKTLYLVIPESAGDEALRPEMTSLPPRLAKIARLVVSGCTDKQIAGRTGLSFSTVRTYVRQIYRRVGVHSRVELVHATNQGRTLAMD
jgi:DNA-binding NarL/FixJ family response regulator